MPSLKIKNLEIKVQTHERKFGTMIKFEDGLNFIRANNSAGKSTCLNGIIYALGLEFTMGPQRKSPLSPAVTRSIETDEGEIAVVESFVEVTIENEEGETAVIRRYPKSPTYDNRLIRVVHNTGLDIEFMDKYVQFEGAAQREGGFHVWLASFVGWELPQVPRYQGGAGPLYQEILWSLIFVEQKRGWSSIQANLPTFLGVRDAQKRSVEFLIGLDAYKLQVRRQTLLEHERELRSQWRGQVDKITAEANVVNSTVTGVPADPVMNFDSDVSPRVWVYENEEWQDIDKVMQGKSSSLEEANHVERKFDDHDY